jgi:hypothetical protein
VLQTINVFLDSEVYIRASFNINNLSFHKLKELCKSNQLKLFITDIVKDECLARIEKNIEDSFISLKNFKKKACIASSSISVSHYFDVIDENQILNDAKNNFLIFLDECKTTELSCDVIKPSDVFSLYFNQEKPFGKGKKKNEFPDAFSFKTIEKTFEINKELIYLISGDLDLEGIKSNRLIYLNNIDQVLELHNANQALISQLKNTFISDDYIIKSKVAHEIESSGISYFNHSNKEIRIIDIKLPSPQIIELDNRSAIITFSSISVFHYIGTLNQLDLDSLDVVDYELDTQKYLSIIDVTFDVKFEFNTNSPISITEVTLNDIRTLKTSYFEDPTFLFR